jgi:hypothetical protein
MDLEPCIKGFAASEMERRRYLVRSKQNSRRAVLSLDKANPNLMRP